LLWESYVAGLNPNDPDSRLLLTGHLTPDHTGYVLKWNPVQDRTYTLWSSSNLFEGFLPLPGASNLPWAVHGYTNATPKDDVPQFYRLEVRKP
jgi:hypothetical protein